MAQQNLHNLKINYAFNLLSRADARWCALGRCVNAKLDGALAYNHCALAADFVGTFPAQTAFDSSSYRAGAGIFGDVTSPAKLAI